MGKSGLCGTSLPTTGSFVFSALRTSEDVPLLWSLFNPHILSAPPNLLLSPRDHMGHVKDLRRGRPPKDKPGGQEMWTQLCALPWLTGPQFPHLQNVAVGPASPWEPGSSDHYETFASP